MAVLAGWHVAAVAGWHGIEVAMGWDCDAMGLQWQDGMWLQDVTGLW